MIDRYLLRYFLAVIDHGNFSKAAAACNVSQPTLSVGIAKLEADLGRPLFLRTNRRVELTEAGTNLASHARRIETEFALAERAVKGVEAATTLRLGVLVTTPSLWVEAFLREWGPNHGPERVEFVEAGVRGLSERLNRGRIDVALTIVDPENARLPYEVLLTEGYSVAMSERHTLADQKVVAAESLANETMIVRRQCELLSETSRHFTSCGVRPFFAARTMSDSRALAYVRAGLGVTIMPDCLVADGVVKVRLADFHHARNIGLLYAPHADVDRLEAGAAIAALRRAIEANGST